jgi:hypothetical protein
MHDSVRKNARELLNTFDGTVPYMYLDSLGYVVVGIGTLLSTSRHATLLPFVHRGSHAPATAEQIAAAWKVVKENQALRTCGHRPFAELSELILTDQGVTELFNRQLEFITGALLRKTPEFQLFDSWPADAQLGLIGMGWAMGAGFAQAGRWPEFRAACAAQDFKMAAAQCHSPHGRTARNQTHCHLFTNAANARLAGHPPEQLFYPQVLLVPRTHIAWPERLAAAS